MNLVIMSGTINNKKPEKDKSGVYISFSLRNDVNSESFPCRTYDRDNFLATNFDHVVITGSMERYDKKGYIDVKSLMFVR